MVQLHTRVQRQETCKLEGLLEPHIIQPLKNAVSGGKISSEKSVYVGGIVGGGIYFGESILSQCFWTNDVGYKVAYANGGATTASLVLVTSLNHTVLNKLNEYANMNSEWSKWVMLHLNGGYINDAGQDTLVAV